MTGELAFIGLGLYGLKGLTLGALDYLRSADAVFIELYTSIVPGLRVEDLEGLLGKRVIAVSRRELEEESGRRLLELAARGARVALLVPGDPMVATTHVALRLEAHRLGVKTLVVNAPSVINAVVGATGLQVYKFGRIATLTRPYPELNFYPDSTYAYICENLERGLHSIVLLDLKAEEGYAMSPREAASLLLLLEERGGRGFLRGDTPVVALSRLGSPSERAITATLSELTNTDLGPPPHTLVVPGLLHPMEVDSLVAFTGASREVLLRWRERLRNALKSTLKT